MTASITDLAARRAIQSAERLIESGVRIKMLGSDEFVENVPVPAKLLEQLLALARGAAEAQP